MALEVPIGGGKTATISEPIRSQFAGNLGGAVEFSFAHFVYKIFEIMGGGVGAFLGGAGVQFLEAIEPSLIIYARPLIEMILELPGLPLPLRDFFNQLRYPAHEGAATILAGISSQAGGAVAGTAISALLKPLANALNAAVRGSVPSVTDLWAMGWRGVLSDGRVNQFMAMNGYFDDLANGYKELARPRAGVGDLLTSAYRGLITFDQLNSELAARGFTSSDINVFTANYQQLMSFNEMLPALYKGVLSVSEVVARMEDRGWSAEDVSVMLLAAKPMPQVGDLIRFGVREAYDDGVSGRWGYDADFPGGFARDMAKLGYDPEWAKYFWRAHWELPSVQLGMEMTHRGIISTGEFEELLRISDYPSGWRSRMQQVIYSPYTRVDVRRMYGMGILDRAGVVKSYHDIGYDDEHAEKLADFTIKYEDENGKSDIPEMKTATLSIISSAVAKGMMSDDDAKSKLSNLMYTPDTAEWIIALAHWKKAVADKPEPQSGFTTDMRNITERAYMNGTIEQAPALAQLVQVGYSSEEAGFILQAVDYARGEQEQEAQIGLIQAAYLNGTLSKVDVVTRLGALDLPSTQQANLLAKWDSVLELPSRRLTEGQYRACFKVGLITADDYTQAMIDLGYSLKDVELLTTLYTVAPETPEE